MQDLSNVALATASIERVLGAVERYAEELPEVRLGQSFILNNSSGHGAAYIYIYTYRDIYIYLTE